jgi:hypothetical protein
LVLEADADADVDAQPFFRANCWVISVQTEKVATVVNSAETTWRLIKRLIGRSTFGVAAADKTLPRRPPASTATGH